MFWKHAKSLGFLALLAGCAGERDSSSPVPTDPRGTVAVSFRDFQIQTPRSMENFRKVEASTIRYALPLIFEGEDVGQASILLSEDICASAASIGSQKRLELAKEGVENLSETACGTQTCQLRWSAQGKTQQITYKKLGLLQACLGISAETSHASWDKVPKLSSTLDTIAQSLKDSAVRSVEFADVRGRWRSQTCQPSATGQCIYLFREFLTETQATLQACFDENCTQPVEGYQKPIPLETYWGKALSSQGHDVRFIAIVGPAPFSGFLLRRGDELMIHYFPQFSEDGLTLFNKSPDVLLELFPGFSLEGVYRSL